MFEEYLSRRNGRRVNLIQWRNTYRPEGVAEVSAEVDGIAEISGIHVKPGCRRDGIGRALVERACLRAKEAGAVMVIAWLGVFDEVMAAEDFLEACGFEEWPREDPLEAPVGWRRWVRVLERGEG